MNLDEIEAIQNRGKAGTNMITAMINAEAPLGAEYARLLRAAALLWLDARQHLLCNLSAEIDDGEWPETGAHLEAGRLLDSMRTAMETMQRVASSVSNEPIDLVWAALDETAALCNYQPNVNWESTNVEGR